MTSYKMPLFLTVLFLFSLIETSGAQSDPNSRITTQKIPDLSIETVNGDLIQLSKLSEPVIVLFLLPKPESMSRGKDLMSDIRPWMDQLREQFNDKVYTLLIVEPLKTSFPFYGIQKQKLKNESFPIMVDKHGEILQKFQLSQSNLHMFITDNTLKIHESKTGSYDDGKKKEIFNIIKHLISINTGGIR